MKNTREIINDIRLGKVKTIKGLSLTEREVVEIEGALWEDAVSNLLDKLDIDVTEWLNPDSANVYEEVQERMSI
jgi:hypothetical protein